MAGTSGRSPCKLKQLRAKKSKFRTKVRSKPRAKVRSKARKCAKSKSRSSRKSTKRRSTSKRRKSTTRKKSSSRKKSTTKKAKTVSKNLYFCVCCQKKMDTRDIEDFMAKNGAYMICGFCTECGKCKTSIVG